MQHDSQQPRHGKTKVPFDRGLDKEDVVHVTMDYYSAIRKDEILPFETIGMDLENVTLSEISHTEDVKNHVISFIHRM